MVSKCTKILKTSYGTNHCKFHFKGVFQGEVLKGALLEAKSDLVIDQGSDYLMHVEYWICEKGILRGKILKIKSLDQCWDRS